MVHVQSSLAREHHALHAESFEQLEGTKLDAQAMQLLQGTSVRGGSETRKQLLKRALLLERAGLPVPAEARLYAHQAPGRPDDTPSASESDSDDDDMPAARRAGPASTSGAPAGGEGGSSGSGGAAMDEGGGAGASAAAEIAAVGAKRARKGRDAGDSSDEDEAAGPRPVRDLSHVAPPLSVTFSRKRNRKGGADDEATAAAQTAAHRAQMVVAKEQMAHLKAEGELPGALPPASCVRGRSLRDDAACSPGVAALRLITRYAHTAAHRVQATAASSSGGLSAARTRLLRHQVQGFLPPGQDTAACSMGWQVR